MKPERNNVKARYCEEQGRIGAHCAFLLSWSPTIVVTYHVNGIFQGGLNAADHVNSFTEYTAFIRGELAR